MDTRLDKQGPDVSAVIVTRGDRPLDEITARIWQAGIETIHVWDNRVESTNLMVYGRYACLPRVASDVVYVQDDDCLLPVSSIRELVDAYEPGVIACNMPERFRSFYDDSALVGFGAVFDRDLPQLAFERFGIVDAETDLFVRRGFFGYVTPVEFAATFFRTCDVVFTTLTPRKLLDVPYEDMPWATDPDRMYRQADHTRERRRVLEMAREVRDGR